ncbi:MAG: tetratricopeptide repeat protein [Sphingomonadales bacterium]
MFEQDQQQTKQIIKDGTIQTFKKDVLDTSMKVPVIVYFWALWCEPCKQLTSTLEKLINELGGKIHLVKINTDQEKELLSQLKVQSPPTVMAFKEGQPVDGFAGVVQISRIKELFDRLQEGSGNSQVGHFMELGKAALEVGDCPAAIQAFGQVAQSDPNNATALGFLAQAYISSGHLDEAKQILAAVPPLEKNNEAVRPAQISLGLMEDAEGAGDLLEAERSAQANPEDLSSQFNYALALIGENKIDLAGDILINIIATETDWNESSAKKQLLKLFEVAGFMDPFTIKYRRKLSSLLFS